MITVAAILATVVMAFRLTERSGLDCHVAFWICVWGIAGAILGGWAWAFAIGGSSFVANPQSVAVLEEGKGVIGAFIGAGAAAALYLRIFGKPLWLYADTLIPAVFVGYALARLGCLAAGCCYGVPTDLPWGIQYAQGSEPFQADLEAGRVSASASHSVRLHPVPLYLSAAGVLLYFATRIARSTPGLALSVALVGYGVIRFPLQFLRGDATPVWGPLDADQLACIAMVVVGVFVWLGRRKRTRFEHEMPA